MRTPRRAPRSQRGLRILHVAAEVWPLVKTGGLADVAAALPAAQEHAGAEARLLLPGLPAMLQALPRARTVAEFGPCFGAARVRLRLGRLPGSGLAAYLVDAPVLYGREGGPYHDASGRDWPDNLQRFGLLGWVGLQLAAGRLDEAWAPQLLHAHDWHAAMACAYLRAHAVALPSVFTVHNLAYQGLFPLHDHGLLGLSTAYANSAGLEYHGHLSFMKAGLKFAHRITTVSPTYAREIATHEFGCGLEGVIRARGSEVRGILNGIDDATWNPAQDPLLAAPYGLTTLEGLSGKALCKAALQQEAGLQEAPQAPLLAVLSRLTAQKGVDLLLAALPGLLAAGAQLVVQGSGDAALEQGLREAAARHPGRVAAFLGYDEARAHRLIAGADLLLMPSRFEPCGLTQLYALRYGTLPVVRRTGGLADTVFDADTPGGVTDHANGFCFERAQVDDLLAASLRGIRAWSEVERRVILQRRGMAADLSWRGPARQYLDLYRELLDVTAP